MGFGSLLAKSIKGSFKPNKLGPIGGIKDAFKKKPTTAPAAAPVAATSTAKANAGNKLSFGKKMIGKAKAIKG